MATKIRPIPNATDRMLALRDWRARMGWTQAEAADALGKSLRTYHQWENEPGAVEDVALLACAALEGGLSPVA